MKYSLGGQLSPQDNRDFAVKAPAYKVLQTLPRVYMVGEDFLQEVRNQGSEGTCVGHAAASGVMGYFLRKHGLDRVLSVRDAYEGGRSMELPPPPETREGTYPRAALKYIHKKGLCLESDWPYSPRRSSGEFGEKPGAESSRPLSKVFSYASIQSLTVPNVKAAVADTGPLLVVVKVFQCFYDPHPESGVVGLPPAGAEADGLHAVVITGWDDARGWRIRNSWGKEWGDGGYCWLPFAYGIEEAWSVVPNIQEAPEPAPPAPDERATWLAVVEKFMAWVRSFFQGGGN